MDDQAGVAGLRLVQDLRHRVVAGIDDAHPQRGRRARRAPGHVRRPVHVRQDLLGLGQERRPRGRQRDVMGAALQQPDAQLTLQPLHLLAQRGLHDVFPRRGAAEVQFFG